MSFSLAPCSCEGDSEAVVVSKSWQRMGQVSSPRRGNVQSSYGVMGEKGNNEIPDASVCVNCSHVMWASVCVNNFHMMAKHWLLTGIHVMAPQVLSDFGRRGWPLESVSWAHL